jgi:hypothetical protein
MGLRLCFLSLTSLYRLKEMYRQMATKKAREENAEVNRRIRNRNRGAAEEADWSSVDGEKLKEVIAAIAKHNCAVQFGYTRDKGAYVIRIVGDGEPYNEFVRPSEDIDLYLEGLLVDFSAE